MASEDKKLRTLSRFAVPILLSLSSCPMVSTRLTFQQALSHRLTSHMSAYELQQSALILSSIIRRWYSLTHCLVNIHEAMLPHVVGETKWPTQIFNALHTLKQSRTPLPEGMVFVDVSIALFHPPAHRSYAPSVKEPLSDWTR